MYPLIIPLIALHLLASGVYLIAVWMRPPWSNRLVVIASIVQAVTILAHLYPSWQLGLGITISLFMWGTVLVSWHLLRFSTTRRLLLIVTATAATMPLLLPTLKTTPSLTIHATLASTVYVIAAGALLQWLDLRNAERALRHNPQASAKIPLLVAEQRCFQYVGLAFALLTLTLISGSIAVALEDKAIFELSHKNLFAWLTWLTFASLLLGRFCYGWRGQKAQTWFFIGYLFLFLSYVGSTFVSQIILNQP